MPQSKKVRTPLPKESMSSIWNSSFQGTPEAGESYQIHNSDHLSQKAPEFPVPALSADATVAGTNPRRVPIGITPSSSSVTNSGRPKHIPIIIDAYPDPIAGPSYGHSSQLQPVKPVSADARVSSHVSLVQRLDSKQPTAPLPSMTRDVRSFSESTLQVQTTPNPFGDPMSEISLATTPEAHPTVPGLGRVLSRYRISDMVDKTMKLRKVFIIALVIMQLAVLSTAAVVAIIFQQIRNGIKPGIAAWLVVSLTLLAAAALTAVIVYWKREKLIKEGGEEFELEDQERGQSARVKDQIIKDLEGRNYLLTQQLHSLRKKSKQTEKKLEAALGQEDLENAISPRQTRTQSWFLQSSRTAVSEPAPTSVISLPPLNFNVVPQQGIGKPARSDTNTTGAVAEGAGGANWAAAEGATSTTDGWETVIGSDDAYRQARIRRLRPGVMRPDELRLLSTEERMDYFAERRRHQQARLLGDGSAFI